MWEEVEGSGEGRAGGRRGEGGTEIRVKRRYEAVRRREKR